MPPITLFKQFSIILFAVLLLVGVLFGRMVTTSLEKNMVNRSKQITAHFIAQNVSHSFLPGELSAPKYDEEYLLLASRIKSMTIGNDVERIKVWNTEMQVTWSDRKELVGLHFTDNADLRRAIEGETVSKVKVPDKSENVYEAGFGRVVELYVPIIRSKTVDAVFEVYVNLDNLYEDINAQKRTVWLWSFIGSAAVFFLLSGIVGKASRRIESQNGEITRSEEMIRAIIDSAKDGIVSIDRAGKVVLFNKAAEQLFGYSASEVVGNTPCLLVPLYDRQSYGEGWDLYLRIRAAKIADRSARFTGLRKDGTLFLMDLSLFVSGKGSNMIGTAIIRSSSGPNSPC
jgi:PAS domain S-box-containing protein